MTCRYLMLLTDSIEICSIISCCVPRVEDCLGCMRSRESMVAPSSGPRHARFPDLPLQ